MPKKNETCTIVKPDSGNGSGLVVMEDLKALGIDLDEELKDIEKSIRIIDKIMQEVLSGKMDHALAKVQDVGKMETISLNSPAVPIGCKKIKKTF